MLKTGFLWLVAFIAFLPSGVIAQGYSDYYTPHGFQVPNLKQGEYLLSLSGTYYDSRTVYESENPGDIDRASNHRDYFTFNGLYCIVDYLIVKAQLSYWPSRVTSESEYRHDEPIQIYQLYEQIPASYLEPRLGLVFKPSPSLEVYGNINFYSYDNERRYYSSPSSPDYVESKSDYRYRFLTFGINYLGKL